MKKILGLFALIILLNSCENVKKGLGMQKDAPDDFLIEKRNPLTMPPNFDLLPPDSIVQEDKKNDKDSLKEMFNKNLDGKKEVEPNKKENSSGSLEKSILDKVR
jgi:PBP1b-binding outer membrane lipoprotein LpoB